MKSNEPKKVEIKSIAELKNWLKKNHHQAASVWLITYKKNVPQYYVEYTDVVDELLCFGWIDSLPRKLDADRKMLRISPRKPKSAWSKINRDKINRLTREGRMKKPGLEAVQVARQNGAWNALKETDLNKIPPDLNKAFSMHSGSYKNFQQFPPSTKRAILEWIAQAKTPETRQKRLAETARLAAQNIRANQYQPKK